MHIAIALAPARVARENHIGWVPTRRFRGSLAAMAISSGALDRFRRLGISENRFGDQGYDAVETAVHSRWTVWA